jgi:hypothetical protein
MATSNVWDTEDTLWLRTSRETFRVRDVSPEEWRQAAAAGDGLLRPLEQAGGEMYGDGMPAGGLPTQAVVLSVARRYAARDYVVRGRTVGALLWRPSGESACLVLPATEIERMMRARHVGALEELSDRPELCTRCGGKFETGTLVYAKLWGPRQWTCYCEPCHSNMGRPPMELAVYARPADWGEKISATALGRMKKAHGRIEELRMQIARSLS